MLELAGENPFKVRAYENGAKALFAFSGNFEAAVASRELLKTPGIGGGLFSNIETLVKTGSLPYYDELRARFPPLRECLRIPGLGARKVRELHAALGVDSLEALGERVPGRGKLAAIKGFGPRSVEKILKGIALVRSSAGLLPPPPDAPRGQKRSSVPRADRLTPPRSRSREASAGRTRSFATSTSSRPRGTGAPRRGFPEHAGRGRMTAEARRRLRPCLPTASPPACASFPRRSFRRRCSSSPARRSMSGSRAKTSSASKLNEKALFRAEKGARLPAASEAEIYAALGLAYHRAGAARGPGRDRGGRARGASGARFGERDLRGLIHVHTTWSDGRDSLEAMVAAARRRLLLRGDHRPQQDRRLRRGPRRGARARAARGDPRAAPALSRIPDLPRHRGGHPGGRVDRLRRRVPAGLRPRRGVHSLALRPLPGRADGEARARGSQPAGLGARASDRPASALPRRDRRGHRGGHRRGGGSRLRPGDQLLAPEAGPGLALLPGAVGKGVPLAIDPDAHSVGELGLVPSASGSPARAGSRQPRL